MVSKKKIITFKLNFHRSPRRKTLNASKMSRKNNSSQLVNAKTLPRVHVSLTRLMPTKMPDIAKNQYYKLVKSSGLLSVLPAGKSSWDSLSPEATPEREFDKSSRNSNLMSPITRTQLQLSPFDMEDYPDLGNEPWSDGSEPYPSPKSPANNENKEKVCWFESPEEHPEVVGLSRRDLVSPCDSEVEEIMARQNSEVPKEIPDILVHRPQPSNGLLQTIIPLQPVDTSLDVSRDDSPVYDRDGIWTSVGKKWSAEKTGQVGLKRKRARPKKKRTSPRFATSVDLSNSVDMDTSSTPANGFQFMEQVSTDERATNLDEVTSSTTSTEFPGKTKSVKNGSPRKRGRPRKYSKLSNDPVPNNSVDFDFPNENARSTVIRPHEAEETSQGVSTVLEKGESPVIVEKAVDSTNWMLQESSRKSADVTNDERSEYRDCYVDSEIEGHPAKETRLLNEQPLVLGALETFPPGNDCALVEEVASEEIPEDGEEQVKETPILTPSRWLRAVHIERSPLIKSLELNQNMNGQKSPIKSTVFFTEKGEKHQLSSNSESTNESSPQGRLRSLRQELFPEKELDASTSILNHRNRTLSETSDLRVSLTPIEVRSSASSSEEVPGLNKEDKSMECTGVNSSPLRRLSVLCERLPTPVFEHNDTCSGSSASLNENINIGSEMAERQEATKRSLSFVHGNQSPLPGNRRPSVLSNGKYTNSDQEQNDLLEGKVELIPCSPILILDSPVFEERQRKRSCSSIGSSKSDAPNRRTSTSTSAVKELAKQSSGRQEKSTDNSLPPNLSPPVTPSRSNTSLLVGTVRLTPCSPIQAVKISAVWKKGKGEERRNSTVRTSPRLPSSSETVSTPNAFKSPVPLKDLVVMCDRVPAGDYNVLRSPENVPVKPTRPQRKRTKPKVYAENKDAGEKEKKKTAAKRKRENKSTKSEKPKKKRKLSIPDHYKNFKPCQLPSISHTKMRYRVAFNLFPQKYSGALDRINQRIMNQNAFWKSLG